MSSMSRRMLVQACRTFAVVAAVSVLAQAAAPKGWFVAGSRPTSYESGTDDMAAFNCHPSAFLKANLPVMRGFGTLMQGFRADHYLGKRVRFTAFVKTERVKSWAGLWMRVDGATKPVAFDNMHDRPITGTTGWQQYEVVLDVPENATSISLGVLLVEAGEIWLNSAKFEVVEPTVLPTNGDAVLKPVEPTNLDFEQ